MGHRNIFRMCVILCSFISFQGWTGINTEGFDGVVRTISAKPFGKLKMKVGAGIHFAQSSDFVKGPTIGSYRGDEIIDTLFPDNHEILQDPAKLFSSNFYIGMGLTDFWDIAMALPVYYDWAGFQDLEAGGLGDLQIALKFLLPPISFKKLFYESFLISVSIPTGTREKGIFPRSSNFLNDNDPWKPATGFYSSSYLAIRPMFALTFDVGSSCPKVPLTIHFNIGGVFTESDKQNSMIGALAIEYALAEFFTVFFDVSGEPRWKNLSSSYNVRKDPLRATPGIRITTPSGMFLSFSGDFSMSSTRTKDRLNWKRDRYEYSTNVIPKYGVQLTFGWNGFMAKLDDDKDSIPNSYDKCSSEPEDMDGYEDSDGCPDPDNDKDGICDPWVAAKGKQNAYASQCKGADKCPNVPEDLDGFQDDDGCPDPDNDGDGIPDAKDQCPNVPEDFDGYQDNDGCPDYDNDKDGVADSVDKCPNDPEDLDGFQDIDGCPDLDNDKDGILDVKDKCPVEPEIFNGYLDEDGCPDTASKPSEKKEPDFPRQQILEGLNFRSGKAEILFESYQILDRLAKALREYPEVEIEIRGYTDSMGKGERSFQLSQIRAEVVRRYLINQGIAQQRIRAVGFGSSNPIADNRTAAGRAMNRRIEVIRIK